MSDSLLEYNLPLSVLMSAVEHAPALVLISSTSTDGVDQQVRIEYVNQVFVRSIGFSRKEIKGEDLLKYLSFSDPAGQPRSLLAMLLFGSTFRDDVILQCADGIRREVYFSVTAFEENNRLYHVWTQQQQSIEDSPSIGASKDASFLHAAFDDSQELVFCVGLNKELLYANKSLLIGANISEEQLNGKLLLQQLENDDERVLEAFESAVQGVPQQFTTSLRQKDGNVNWFHFTVTPLNIEGQITGVYFVGYESTSDILRLRHEKMLEQILAMFNSKSGLRANLEQMLQLICQRYDWECGECWLPDQHYQKNKLFAWHYPEQPAFNDFLAISSTLELTNYTSDALRTHKGHALTNQVTNLFLDANFPRRNWAEKAGLKSGFTVPVVNEGKTVALITFFSSSTDLAKEAELIHLIKMLASHIGIRIEQSRLAYDFNQVFELVPDFLCVLDVSGRFYRANRHLRETIGLSAEELTSHSFFEFVDETYAESALEFFQRLKSERLIHFEIAFISGENRLLLEWSLSYNPQEGIIYGAAKDVTLRVRYDEELRISNERFHRISQATNDVIYDWDISHNRIEWAENFQRLFGHEDVNLYNTYEGWGAFIHPADIERVHNNLQVAQYQQRSTNWVDEYRYQCADGTYKFILDRGTFIRNEKGEPIRMIGAMQDITALKESEETLIHLNDALQHRARQLQGFNKELEQFAYIVSHDLQEPLRMISSFMQLLLNSNDIEKNEKSEQYINFAIDGATRMKRLIQDLLTYSRVGTTEEDFSELNTTEILNDTLLVYQQVIRDKDAKIHVGELPRIRGIASLIGQIFDNLLSNALKYCEKAFPVIDVTSYDTATHHVFCFKDNGIGIDSRHFDTIYLPFKRLHNRNEYSGTGIGLAVCKKIADKHNGQIWVESKPGEGSTFYFSVQR